MTLTLPPPQAAPAAPSTDVARVRRTGLALAATSAFWSLATYAMDAHQESEVGQTITDAVALPFQLSLFALVAVQLRTRATGTGRVAVGLLHLERVFLALATAYTVLHGAFPSLRGEPWLAVLDAFWPLSMLGMLLIGVKIAFAGRWRGPLRGWPAFAESWALFAVPSYVLFGTGVASVVGATHLLLGYTLLGLLLHRRPDLTGAR